LRKRKAGQSFGSAVLRAIIRDSLMDTSALSARTTSSWKKLSVIAASFGAGFGLTCATVIGGVAWYKSQPRPWNTKAVISVKPPGFGVGTDGKTIILAYTLENSTKRDFRLDSASPIQVFERTKDGTLIGPFSDGSLVGIHFPVVIPAGQKTGVLLMMHMDAIPTRSDGERDEAYHEDIRKFLEQKHSELGEFVVFDSTDRYEVDLPKWRSERSP